MVAKAVLSKQKIASWCDGLENFKVPNKIQFRDYSIKRIFKGWWHGWFIAHFFVANVNVNDDGRLNVNVNRLENGNVWNAENRNRVVIPKLAVSPA